jgi:group I intron endonuclease
MVAYQYRIRKEKELTETLDFDQSLISLDNTDIRLIDKKTATNIILEYEWLHSMPFANKYFFGIYFKISESEYLGGVLVFGNEYSENTGNWDKYEYRNKLLLLSRGVCLWWTPKNTASYFISRALKWIKTNTQYRIITATVDPAAGEIGTIYQSLNWVYVGLMSGNYHGNKMATRFGVMINGKLRFSRWIRNKIGTMKREEVLKHYPDAIFVPQYRKQRYFYFIGNKSEIKKNHKAIEHLILPYPKRNNEISGIIYLIKNKINNKIYIGQTIRSFRDRIHEYELGLGNQYLNKAFNKYGFNSFEFKIIDTANNLTELNEKEIRYIRQYKSNDKDFGYNIESGGKNAIPITETIEKMSKSHIGIKQTSDWISRRIAKAGTKEAKKYGKIKSNEEKKELSENSTKYWKGKKRNNETKKKISETKLKNGLSNVQKKKICKKVYLIDINNNIIIKEYESTANASLSEKINQSTISRRCKVNKIINGIMWTYNAV